jgi:hypothetical protein
MSELLYKYIEARPPAGLDAGKVFDAMARLSRAQS